MEWFLALGILVVLVVFVAFITGVSSLCRESLMKDRRK